MRSCFAPESRKAPKGTQGSSDGIAEGQVLAALNLGFTTADIREMTVAEVLRFADAALPSDEGENGVRRATQADINAFAAM